MRAAGRLTLVTKPGVVVDTDDVAAEGSYLKVQAHRGPDAPAILLRIQVSGKVSGGHITGTPATPGLLAVAAAPSPAPRACLTLT